MAITNRGVVNLSGISRAGFSRQVIAAEESNGAHDLDLSSTVQTIQASGNFSSATIDAGGAPKTVLPGDHLSGSGGDGPANCC